MTENPRLSVTQAKAEQRTVLSRLRTLFVCDSCFRTRPARAIMIFVSGFYPPYVHEDSCNRLLIDAFGFGL